MTGSWSAPTTPEEAARRAAGRGKYNAHRQALAHERQVEVVRRMVEYGFGRGVKARIARELGVACSTVSRDVRAAARRIAL